MLEKDFETIDEVRRRLAGSYILYKGSARLVTDVYLLTKVLRDPEYYQGVVLPGKSVLALKNKLQVWVDAGTKYLVHFDRGVCVPLEDPDIDIKTFKVGMVNTQKGNAYYIKRLPARGNYRQGLNARNMAAFSCSRAHKAAPQGYNSLLTAPYLNQCIKNQYPVFEKARKNLVSDRSIAFNRDMAIAMDSLGLLFLQYKEYRVAWSDDNGDSFTLAASFAFLTEALDKHNIPHKIAA